MFYRKTAKLEYTIRLATWFLLIGPCHVALLEIFFYFHQRMIRKKVLTYFMQCLRQVSPLRLPLFDSTNIVTRTRKVTYLNI